MLNLEDRRMSRTANDVRLKPHAPTTTERKATKHPKTLRSKAVGAQTKPTKSGNQKAKTPKAGSDLKAFGDFLRRLVKADPKMGQSIQGILEGRFGAEVDESAALLDDKARKLAARLRKK